MAYQIKNWKTGEVIHEYGNTVIDCLENGVAAGVAFSFAKLNYAELSYAELNGAKLNYAKLNYAELNGAKLNDAKLNYAKLNYAELNGAKLNNAELNNAELNDAELNNAELNNAELNDAELNGAKLNNAKLNGAELNGANLESIKYEFFGKLAIQFQEIDGLRQAIVEGKINGSYYEGDCACFVGTIANVAHKNYRNLAVKPNADSLTERWFLALKEGDAPDTNPIAKITLGWIDEFLLLTNIPAEGAAK